ncbi:MAG TPA: hypothetical protein VF212_17920 [Longimicrobiales bacterium]
MMKHRSVKLPALLLALIVAWGARPGTAAAQTGDDAGLAEMVAYRLTMDKVQRWYEAQRNVYEKYAADPGLAERAEIGADEEEFSIDGMAARFDAIPEVREAIQAAGLGTREFVVVTMVLFQSAMAHAVIEMGGDRDEILEGSGVHPANLDFVAAHKAELERMQKEVEALKASVGASN